MSNKKTGKKYKRVKEIITLIDSITDGKKSKWKGDLLLYTYICEALDFNTPEEREWLVDQFSAFGSIMREADFNRRLRQRGFDEKPSLEEENLQSQRELFVIFVKHLFPELESLAEQQARFVTDVEIFQDMIDRLVKVQTIEEAKHILMAESYHR
jgi:hypothetical protein